MLRRSNPKVSLNLPREVKRYQRASPQGQHCLKLQANNPPWPPGNPVCRCFACRTLIVVPSGGTPEDADMMGTYGGAPFPWGVYVCRKCYESRQQKLRAPTRQAAPAKYVRLASGTVPDFCDNFAKGECAWETEDEARGLRLYSHPNETQSSKRLCGRCRDAVVLEGVECWICGKPITSYDSMLAVPYIKGKHFHGHPKNSPCHQQVRDRDPREFFANPVGRFVFLWWVEERKYLDMVQAYAKWQALRPDIRTALSRDCRNYFRQLAGSNRLKHEIRDQQRQLCCILTCRNYALQYSRVGGFALECGRGYCQKHAKTGQPENVAQLREEITAAKSTK